MAQAKYITVAELAERYDTRTLGQLSSDDGTEATVDSNNAILLNAIEVGSSDVESAALRGGRYTTTDLAALQTADDWSLKGLVAQIAIVRLHERRPSTLPDFISEMRLANDRALKDLREGNMIFNDADAIAGGKPSVQVISSGIRAQLGLVSDSSFFPQRRTVAY